MPTGNDLPQGDVLENLPEPFWWQRRWAALSPRGRRWVVVTVVLALLGGGALWWVDRAAERELRQRVDLATRLGVWTSSTSPPGGAVGWFVLVRNDGREPVTVTSLAADGSGLTLTDQGEDRSVPPGREVEVPVSIRVTCADLGTDPDAVLPLDVGVRRSDGGPAGHRGDLDAALVLDVAGTLCSVRPALRDHELSGPVLRPAAAPGE